MFIYVGFRVQSTQYQPECQQIHYWHVRMLNTEHQQQALEASLPL